MARPATFETGSETETKRPSLVFFKSGITYICFFFLTATILYLGGISPRARQVLPQSTPTEISPLEELDHVLHPESHIHRKPSTFHHEWTITEAARRPDGVRKDVYLVNNLLPGPVLEARSGDTLIINVANNLTRDQGLSIHWHGLYMREQNQFDGAVGFTQSPIQPGTNFTYEITIAEDQWGTFWYHAHDQVQRADGLFGALIIHRPVEEIAQPVNDLQLQQDVEDRLLLVGDWYHRAAEDVLKWYMRAGSFGNEPVPDSLLINGKGAYNCSMAVPARPVDCEQRTGLTMPKLSLTAGKRYRFRLINHGSLAGFAVGFNTAVVQVLQVDGGNQVSADGEGSSVGIVYPGQRTDIIVTPRASTTDSDAPYLSVSLDRENFKYPNHALTDVQRFPVELLNTSISSTLQSTVRDSQHLDLETITTLTPHLMPQKSDLTIVVYTATQKLSHLHNVPHGFMNQTSWKPQQDPPIPLINLSRDAWDKNQFVPKLDRGVISGHDNAPWVDLVVNNLDDGGHPFHLHGYDVYVLSSYSADRGWGSYNPFEVPEEPPGGVYNLLSPVKRDTFFVPRRGYTVVRFQASNAGIWMFHCHLLWHQASGMAMAFEIT